MNFSITVGVPVSELKQFYNDALSKPETAATLVEDTDDLKCILALKVYLSLLSEVPDDAVCQVEIPTLGLIWHFQNRYKASKKGDN